MLVFEVSLSKTVMFIRISYVNIHAVINNPILSQVRIMQALTNVGWSEIFAEKVDENDGWKMLESMKFPFGMDYVQGLC